MKPTYIIIAILFVAIATILWVSLWRTKSSKPTFKTTDELMRYLSNQAVEMAEHNFGVRLDYSPQSIEKLDFILGKLHEEYQRTKPSEGVHGLAMAYGAYIGEVIRRSEPDAKWDRDDPVGGEKSYPIRWRGGSSFVCGWCYRRIINGDEDNVWFKYQATKNWKTNDVTK